MFSVPRVGVGVIILRNGKVLLGKRKNAHGEGTWAFPGGHLDFGESPEECAVREVEEETGLRIGNLRNGAFTNDVFEKEGRHYITLYMVAEHLEGEAEVREPDKCEQWEWFSWDELPEPRFIPLMNLLEQGFRPFEKLL